MITYFIYLLGLGTNNTFKGLQVNIVESCSGNKRNIFNTIIRYDVLTSIGPLSIVSWFVSACIFSLTNSELFNKGI